MIQINLLPDIKLEYIKARRLKRTVFAICAMVSGASLLLFILLFLSVTVAQTRHLSNLETDITDHTNELKAMPDLAKILTIQNQLGELSSLHNSKPVASRMFTYIGQLAPRDANITTLTVNFDEQSMTIEGNAPSLASVNKFIDTLKFTTYKLDTINSVWQADNKYKQNDVVGRNGELYTATADHTASNDTEPGVGSQWKSVWKQTSNAFSEVVLSEFGVDESAEASRPANYTIKLKYAPAIFDSQSDSKLIVPNQVTTRSATERPTNVFDLPTGREDER